MAEGFFNSKDSVDISELAALNNDISDDLIDKLQHQLSEKITPNQEANVNEKDDTTLFEESASNDSELPTENNEQPAELKQENSAEAAAESINPEGEKKEKVEVNKSFDDNFIKKYKAKLQKRAQGKDAGNADPVSYGGVAPMSGSEVPGSSSENQENTPIESLSQGNITERPLTEELKEYNDSLDFLDGNVKYSKYVIYIDPENTDFIEGLTVKERKNLINRVLRQQNDIAITKQRFKIIQTVIRHTIILIITVAVTIPIVYHVINASLEATINNHMKAQTNWQTLYKEHGKITRN